MGLHRKFWLSAGFVSSKKRRGWELIHTHAVLPVIIYDNILGIFSSDKYMDKNFFHISEKVNIHGFLQTWKWWKNLAMAPWDIRKFWLSTEAHKFVKMQEKFKNPNFPSEDFNV